MSKEIEVETEVVERPTGNLFGKTLSKLRDERIMAVMSARQKMFERHKISFNNQDKYKIVQERLVVPSGKEVIELRLYQLIDGATVTITSEIKSELAGGIHKLKEFSNE